MTRIISNLVPAVLLKYISIQCTVYLGKQNIKPSCLFPYPRVPASVPQGACFNCIFSLSVLFDTISCCLSYVTISLWPFLRRYRKTGSQVVLPIFCVLSAIHDPSPQLPTHARLSWRGHTITGNRSPTQVHR